MMSSSAAAVSSSPSTVVLLPNPPYSLQEVQQHHAHIVKAGLTRSSFAAGRLLYTAATTSPPAAALGYCLSIFDRIPEPKSFAWNAMILAYAGSSNPQLALLLFADMLACGSGVLPDRFTFPLVLKVCAALGATEEARQVHARVVKSRFCSDMFVMNTLLHAYATAGRKAEADALFDRMPEKDDAVSWNVLISSYAMRGDMGRARSLFDAMPAAVKNMEIWNTMVSGYGNAGMLDDALALFDEMPDRDVVSWNAMVSGYARANRFSDVLATFQEMLRPGDVKPDARTLVTVLSACARLGALRQGEWVHAYMDGNGFEAEEGFLCSALVDMYSKCGNIDKAVSVFEGACGRRRPKDVSSWNSMIGGLGSHGRGLEAVELFEEMAARGVERNEVTFVNVLTACSQGGLVEQGKRIFHELLRSGSGSSASGVKPNIKHYGCMVDLLARAGELEEAVRLITCSSVPNVEDGAEEEQISVLWESLLVACRSNGDVELAELVARKLAAGTSRLEPRSYPLVQLSNLYASVGRWDDVDAVRAAMRGLAVRKEPGCSSIEVDGTVHEFFSGDRPI